MPLPSDPLRIADVAHVPARSTSAASRTSKRFRRHPERPLMVVELAKPERRELSGGRRRYRPELNGRRSYLAEGAFFSISASPSPNMSEYVALGPIAM